jgi:glutamate-1-semialdehyde 2,1-aminomutase
MSNNAKRLDLVEQLTKEVTEAIPASAAQADRARSNIPGATTRGRFWWPIPIYLTAGEGPRVRDIDGRSYIDCNLGFGPLILGHCHPIVTEALLEQLNRGTLFGPPTEAESELAELIVDNVPNAEKVVFTSTGTEATLGAVRLARAATGRQRVAKFEGGWHGIQDYLLHSFSSFGGPPSHAQTIPDAAGIPDAARDSVVVLPYNDPAAFERLNAEGGDLACVVIELVQGGAGAIPVEQEFLEELRELCTRLGIILVFDEIITGFRLGAAGGAGLYGVQPDLVTLGKVVGGGMNVGAVCGPSRYLNLTVPGADRKAASMGGTHSANPMSMTAGRAQLGVLLNDPLESYGYLDELGQRMRSGLEAVLADAHVSARVTGVGSLWGLHFLEQSPRNLRDQASGDSMARFALAAYLLLEGVLVSAPMHLAFLSTAHTVSDVDDVVDGHRRAIRRMQSDGWLAN